MLDRKDTWTAVPLLKFICIGENAIGAFAYLNTQEREQWCDFTSNAS